MTEPGFRSDLCRGTARAYDELHASEPDGQFSQDGVISYELARRPVST